MSGEKDENLFEVASDYGGSGSDSDSDDEAFKPGRGIHKRDSTGNVDEELELDKLRDADETKYKPILDGGDEDDEVVSTGGEGLTSSDSSGRLSGGAPGAAGTSSPANNNTGDKKKTRRVGIPGLSKFVFIRDAGGFMTQPSFRLMSEETGEVILLARKKQIRSPHVHLYSVSGDSKTHLKKLKETEVLRGVLMATSDLMEYKLVVDDAGKIEIGACSFDKTSIFTEMVHGFQPRRLSGIIPLTDATTKQPVPHNIKSGGTSLSTHLRSNDVDLNRNFNVLRTKEPVFQDGCYRLNFHGRASVPSVKNFQLVAPQNVNDVLCQFGKFGDDEFHLDFKLPISPLQAFAIAICQFNNV